jgi:hypothetical protein
MLRVRMRHAGCCDERLIRGVAEHASIDAIVTDLENDHLEHVSEEKLDG